MKPTFIPILATISAVLFLTACNIPLPESLQQFQPGFHPPTPPQPTPTSAPAIPTPFQTPLIPPTSPPPVTISEDLTLDTLQPGTCFRAEPNPTTKSIVTLVSCDDKWDYQTLNSFTLHAEEGAPSPEEIFRQSLTRCHSGFTQVAKPPPYLAIKDTQDFTCYKESFGLSRTHKELLNNLTQFRQTKPGQCLKYADDLRKNLYEVVDCTGRYHLKVLSTFENKGQHYPSRAGLNRAAVLNCDRNFDLPIHPTQEEWTSGQRTTTCVQTSSRGDGSSPQQQDVVNTLLLSQGECFQIEDDITGTQATIADCQHPQAFEVAYTYTFSDNDQYPGLEKVITRADDLCYGERLYTQLLVTEQLWLEGYRTILCAGTPEVQLQAAAPEGDSEQTLAQAQEALALGITLSDQAQYSEAITALTKASDLFTDPSADTETWLGYTYQDAGNPEKALQHFTNAVAIDDNPKARINRAYAYLALDSLDQAAADAQKALEGPAYKYEGYDSKVEAQWVLSLYHQETGNPQQASSLATDALRLARESNYAQQDLDALSALTVNILAALATPTPVASIFLRTPTPTPRVITTVPLPSPTATTLALPTPTPAGADQGRPLSTPVPSRSGAGSSSSRGSSRLGQLTSLQNAKWIQQAHPQTANQIASLPWVADGVDDKEEKVLEELLYIFFPNHGSAEQSLVTMPFLQSIEGGEQEALDSLVRVKRESTRSYSKITNSNIYRNGINDEWTPVIAALGASKHQPSLVEDLLDPQRFTLDSRTISISGKQVQLNIVRLARNSSSAHTMDKLEKAVRDVDSSVDAPFPRDAVTILYAGAVIQGYVGHNAGSHIVISPEYENATHPYAQSILDHEVAHYYWTYSGPWADEGVASFTQVYLNAQRSGQQIKAKRPACGKYTNLNEIPNTRHAHTCHYDLGEKLFVALYQAVGEHEFRSKISQFYHQSEQQGHRNPTTVEDLKSIFNSPKAIEVIDHWYFHR